MKASTPMALITGASAGLGAEFALQLARHGEFSLLLVARRRERLEALKSRIEREFAYGREGRPRVVIGVFDLTIEAERHNLCELVQAEGDSVELLINNAGFGSVGNFAELPTEREVSMVRLNVEALVHLTSYFCRRWVIESTETSRRRTVMNLASTAAFQPLPFMATYAATKAFVVSFGYALAMELSAANIQIVTICPGPTETEFHLAAGLSKKIDNLPGMSAEQVVEAALGAIGGRRPLKVTGVLNACLAGLAKILPFSISARVAKRLLRRYVG